MITIPSTTITPMTTTTTCSTRRRRAKKRRKIDDNSSFTNNNDNDNKDKVISFVSSSVVITSINDNDNNNNKKNDTITRTTTRPIRTAASTIITSKTITLPSITLHLKKNKKHTIIAGIVAEIGAAGVGAAGGVELSPRHSRTWKDISVALCRIIDTKTYSFLQIKQALTDLATWWEEGSEGDDDDNDDDLDSSKQQQQQQQQQRIRRRNQSLTKLNFSELAGPQKIITFMEEQNCRYNNNNKKENPIYIFKAAIIFRLYAAAAAAAAATAEDTDNNNNNSADKIAEKIINHGGLTVLFCAEKRYIDRIIMVSNNNNNNNKDDDDSVGDSDARHYCYLKIMYQIWAAFQNISYHKIAMDLLSKSQISCIIDSGLYTVNALLQMKNNKKNIVNNNNNNNNTKKMKKMKYDICTSTSSKTTATTTTTTIIDYIILHIFSALGNLLGNSRSEKLLVDTLQGGEIKQIFLECVKVLKHQVNGSWMYQKQTKYLWKAITYFFSRCCDCCCSCDCDCNCNCNPNSNNNNDYGSDSGSDSHHHHHHHYRLRLMTKKESWIAIPFLMEHIEIAPNHAEQSGAFVVLLEATKVIGRTKMKQIPGILSILGRIADCTTTTTTTTTTNNNNNNNDNNNDSNVDVDTSIIDTRTRYASNNLLQSLYYRTTN